MHESWIVGSCIVNEHNHLIRQKNTLCKAEKIIFESEIDSKETAANTGRKTRHKPGYLKKSIKTGRLSVAQQDLTGLLQTHLLQFAVGENQNNWNLQGRSHWEGGVGEGARGPWSHTSISEPNKVQQFQFQTSGILLFTGVQKLYGPEISQFFPCMLQFLTNLLRIFIFSNQVT